MHDLITILIFLCVLRIVHAFFIWRSLCRASRNSDALPYSSYEEYARDRNDCEVTLERILDRCRAGGGVPKKVTTNSDRPQRSNVVTVEAVFRELSVHGFDAPLKEYKPPTITKDVQPKFRVGQWIRENKTGRLGKIVQVTPRYNTDPEQCYNIFFGLSTFFGELSELGIGSGFIQSAMPRRGEWWKWEECAIHGHASPPWRVLVACLLFYVHPYMACGCLVPVNFGRGK